MTTVQHHVSPDYPNGKTETAKMFAHARELGLYPPFAVGDRVEILVGGYSGETGRITEVKHDPAGGAPFVAIYLDTLYTLRGYHPAQLRRVA